MTIETTMRGDDDDDDAWARLEADYCPPLDPALLSAIASDYDRRDAQSLRDARATLDQLKESALVEEAAGFDPSGTGAQDVGAAEDDEVGSPDRHTASSPDPRASRTQTDWSSLSNGVSSLDLDEDAGAALGGSDVGDAEELERLDDRTKVRLLQELFGDRLSRYTIEHTLRKRGGKWQAAMEELLNHVYFAEAEVSDDGGGGDGKIAAKGIDAFSEEYMPRPGRKARAKRKRQKALEEQRGNASPVSAGDSPTPPPSKWQTAARDVEFIASRTRIANAAVASVYYEQGASTSKTIGALLKASMEESRQVVTDDAAVSARARALGSDFPTIAPDYLAALVRLTYPSAEVARELALALTAKPADMGGSIQIIPRFATPPAADADSEGSWQAAAKKERPRVQPSAPDSPTAAAKASAYASARAAALAQASAAHRRAKSDRLMGGVAAYYGQVGREYAALSSAASAAAADELAAAQSTSTQVDLHGMDVLNGVRIAQERVEAWWTELGERRANGRLGADDRQAGYTIVVGLGRHSEGGQGKLGPAVVKALRQDGWRVEPAGAVVVVRGKVKKK